MDSSLNGKLTRERGTKTGRATEQKRRLIDGEEQKEEALNVVVDGEFVDNSRKNGTLPWSLLFRVDPSPSNHEGFFMGGLTFPCCMNDGS